MPNATQPAASLVTVLALLLVAGCAHGAPAGRVLHRCQLPGEPPAWQEAPCAPEASQRVLAVPKAESRPPAPVAAATMPRHRDRRAAPVTAQRRRGPALARAAAACQQARQAASERSAADGRRLPVREIRARERRALQACRR